MRNHHPCSGCDRDINCAFCGVRLHPLSHRIKFCSRHCHMKSRAVPLEKRFWAKVDRRGPDECWVWKAGTNEAGYGRIRAGGVGSPDLMAHRYSWSLANGQEIPDGMFACHRCDNPPCVNPAHLFIGTPLDNIRDAIAKGRARYPEKRTHCSRGHEFTADNIYLLRDGGRRCRTCHRAHQRGLYHQRRAA